jgi:translation initiation factor IF-2
LVKEKKCKDAYEKVVFFCVLKIMPHCVFNKKDLIVVGVNVIIGVAKFEVGTPLCASLHEMTLILTKLCPGKATI